MKHEKNGLLFDIALKKLGQEGCYNKSLLIDDSKKACATFFKKGGNIYRYSNYKNFEKWKKLNFDL